MPSCAIQWRAWNIFTLATYFAGLSPMVCVKACAKLEREAPIRSASAGTSQSRSGSAWMAAITLPIFGQRTAAIQPVASLQPHSTHARMMLAASTSAMRARMPQAPMRSSATSRSIASSSTGTVGSRWARSPARITSGIMAMSGCSGSRLKRIAPQNITSAAAASACVPSPLTR